MSRILTITGVNLRRFLRERSNAFFVFIFPIALILVIGVSFGSGFAPRLGVVAGDDPQAQQLVGLLGDQDGIDIVEIDDQDALISQVESGALTGGVVIPDDYGEVLSSGTPVVVEFLARPEGSGAMLAPTVSAVVAVQAEEARAALIVAEETGTSFDEAGGLVAAVDESTAPLDVSVVTVGDQLFGEDLGQYDVGAPAQVVLFSFLTGLTAAAALIQSRQLGVSRRMLSTPTSSSTILIGEAAGRLSVVVFQGGYIMIVSALIFGVNWGDPVAAALLLIVFSMVGAGAGLLMGSVFSNDQQVAGIGVILGLVLAALGGCMVPLEIFPENIRTIAHFTPHAWALDGFAELVRHGGGLSDIWREIGVLLGFATVLMALASWRFRVTLTK